MGSTREARRAGTQAAKRATARRRLPAAVKDAGSDAVRP